MENTIATRVFDFLKEFPPFNLLEKELLTHLASKVVVQYRQPGEVIFRQGELPGQYIFVVREGAVALYRLEDGEKILIDECDEGDVFGIRPLLAERSYLLTAAATEETLLYAVPVNLLKEVWENNPRVAYYLATTFAEGVKQPFPEKMKGHIFLQKDHWIDGHFHLGEVQSADYSKNPVTCLPSDPIREAARIMTGKDVGSIIVVDENQFPVGIVTDKDLRKKVATGDLPLGEPVASIMSSPVITVLPEVTVADVQMEMVRNRIHHLCITEDGTDRSRVIGVISEHDLLVIQGNNPAILIRETRRSKNIRELCLVRERAEDLLRKYIYQEVSIAYISSILTEINDALIVRCIELSLLEMEAEGYRRPEVDFCWLSLGSEGRGEQLLRTDQDSALVFDQVEEEKYDDVKAYFLILAGKTTTRLRRCGFEYCPADMMASNPEWCLSLDQWKHQFSEWILEPTPKAVMFCTIFFDYRPVYGKKELAEKLTGHIFQEIEKQTVFLGFLAKNALENPPPLTFFRNFMVEKGGEHKDNFDIKARAMMPLADAARLLVLSSRIGKVNNTIRRFEKLADLEPQNRELYEEAAEAYEILMRYRTVQGLKNADSGRYFDPSDLSKLERIQLRNSFRPIRDIQSLIATRFQVVYFR